MRQPQMAVPVEYVYGLVLDNQLVYVGRTDHPYSRFNCHRHGTVKGEKGDLEMVVLECCPRGLVKWAESSWIAVATAWGCNLRNKMRNKYHDYPSQDRLKNCRKPEKRIFVTDKRPASLQVKLGRIN